MIRRALKIWLVSVLTCSFAFAADADPRKPAAIQTQDVPVVSAEIVAKLSQYQNTRAAAFRGWAPDGNGMLIATRFGNAAQLHLVTQPGGRREQLTFFDEPVAGRFLPHVSDGALLLSVDRGGNENAQLWLLDRKNFQTKLLSDGKSRNLVQAWNRDGSAVIVASNRRNGKDMDLYRVNPRKPDSFELLMAVNGQTWQADDWSNDGKRLVLRHYVSINESYAGLFDVEKQQLTELPLPTSDKVAIGQLAFSPDGRSVYVTTDADSEFLRLARLDLATKKWTWLSDGLNWDVDDLTVDRTHGTVAFAINDNGKSRVFLSSEKTNDRRIEFRLPQGVVSGLEFSPDSKSLGFTLARAEAPAEAYSLQLSNGELTRWTFSEVGGLDPASFVDPTLIEFPSFDGRKIPAFYFKPRTAKEGEKRPVIISIHGGPEGQYRPTFTAGTQFWANELGLAVLHPNVRGSAGYGKTYLKLDNAEKREDSVKDIGGLLDWIKEQPDLDPSRVAVIGGSYGGYMVLATLTNFGDRIKAGIDIVGICNFITFMEKTAAYRVDLRRAEYGDERKPEMRAVFDRIAPLHNTDKIKSELLVIHGRNDPRVPFFEAEQIAAKVRAGGRSVWTVFADNEGHGFAKKENADYQRAVEAMFLKKHLGLK
ncbi:MAG: S9 family peptidase [Planctomycetes bacterium]|nr:S9 family peptidase [Planctomycetota bacterium]